ncbi:MAG: hypothetical protein HY983_03510 [Candidatus Magasanikbacteria bacterium]|nr:hypothetical protein [Candidatus Magasanikbacteria bacterium]
MQNYEQQIARLLDVALVDKFLAESQNKELGEKLFDHLHLLYIATGNASGLEIYDTPELVEIIVGKKTDYDPLRYVRSLFQSIHGENHHTEALAALVYLRFFVPAAFSSSIEQAVLVLLLDMVWAEYNNLLSEDQLFLAGTYFYQSCILHVPVGEALKSTLYFTTSPEEYAELNKRFVDAIEQNVELVETPGGGSKKFLDLCHQYFKAEGAAAGQKENLKKFIVSLYPASSVLGEGLLEALRLYVALQQGNLVAPNLGGEKDEADAYGDELANLISYFFDRSSWKKISAYYKNTKAPLPFAGVAREIVKNIDLTKESAPQFLLDFTDFLHQNKLLPDDQELIEFHEEDGQFHWNDAFTV